MKPVLLLAVTVCLFAVSITTAADDARIYELRVYTATPGKLEALNARFRDHTCRLFEKHGMTNVGYWTPIDNKENKLIYILSFPSRDAQTKSWAAFGADPEWQKARTDSEINGRLVTKVDSTLLTATNYSPAVKPEETGDRVFELRTYTATPGKLDALNARFRDHTLKLFDKHGMTNVGYWTPIKGQRGKSDDMLIYLLAHKSTDGAKKSWDSFRADPDWLAARKASEDKAGGSLTVAGPDGVKSEFVKPTDYSPMK